ncbi:hypothetical protein [Listeria fleischmannii]|uniref:Phage protein n=1 Tax=Listeria fleischmannii FSL S10-1203 TaxID=1265822 RepID=W7DQF2_9LIST|nr:hypothetical protein [Listeria fleischmannii]EUJ59563.1 phage protein [Listeria fleischmannii FSL S10-1203]
MAEQLNRQDNAIQGSEFRNKLNENWDMIERYIGIGTPSPAEVVSTIFPLAPENLEGAELENYFNKERIEVDKSIANLTGQIVEAVGANASGFIRIKDFRVLGSNYNYNTAGCFYDANFRYITFARFAAGTVAGWYTVTPPENAVYVRVVVNNAHLDTYMLRPSDEKPVQYFPHAVSVSWLKPQSVLFGKKNNHFRGLYYVARWTNYRRGNF